LILYAALGNSCQLVVGPMAATAALSAATVAALVPVGNVDRFTAMTAGDATRVCREVDRGEALDDREGFVKCLAGLLGFVGC
jgi:MFS superfamily sulfate permease-like transporter